MCHCSHHPCNSHPCHEHLLTGRQFLEQLLLFCFKTTCEPFVGIAKLSVSVTMRPVHLLLSTAKRLELPVVECASIRLDDAEFHRRLCTRGRFLMYQTRPGVWYQDANGNENGKNSHDAGAALHAVHPPYAVENLGSGSGLCGKCFACLDAHKGCQLVHSSCWVLRVCKGTNVRGMLHMVYAKAILCMIA